MRTTKKFHFSLTNDIKEQLLAWAQQFQEVVWLDSNNYPQKHKTYEAILAVDALTAIKTDTDNAFNELNEYQITTSDWLFGYLTYDLKNDVEKLTSHNYDGLHFPDLFFFQPKKVFLFYDGQVEIQYLNFVADELKSDWQEIITFKDFVDSAPQHGSQVKIGIRTTKDSYMKKANKMLDHIKRGDIYEANLCQEFYSEETQIDPLKTFLHLNKISSPPFSAFLKLDELFALSTSPERYIKKGGNSIISQPIKGTAKRMAIEIEDQQIKEQLLKDSKERSENIMITDLVRNDLSRIAEKGSVQVEELCEVYTFKQVHQMISTINCTVPEGISSVEILRNTFPMGSMTGAPKISAMQIIETLEDAKRGLYSGAIGYFTPEGNFDFNVVIRSILYNSQEEYVSFSVGSAITINSIPENEFEECLLKAKAMREVLNAKF